MFASVSGGASGQGNHVGLFHDTCLNPLFNDNPFSTPSTNWNLADLLDLSLQLNVYLPFFQMLIDQNFLRSSNNFISLHEIILMKQVHLSV